MAKKSTKKKDALPMEEMLWKACDALRGSIEPSEYKHVVLSLIFLKYAGFHFEKRRQEIIAAGQEAFVDNVAFYTAKNVFYLPETSRWSFLKKKSILNYVCQNGDIQVDVLLNESPFDDANEDSIFPGKFHKVGEFVTHLHISITAA